MLERMSRDQRCDIAIVGAGILGLACARELARRDARLYLHIVDQETTVGLHQSGHNSGVIHAGMYYAPGSLKARYVSRAPSSQEYCAEHGIPTDRVGKLVIAADEGELPALRDLHERARNNRVPGITWVDGPDIAQSSHTRAVSPRCTRRPPASSTTARSPALSRTSSSRPATRSSSARG